LRQLMKQNPVIKKVVDALGLKSECEYNCQIVITQRKSNKIHLDIKILQNKSRVGTIPGYVQIDLNTTIKTVTIHSFFPSTNELGIKGFGDIFMSGLIKSILASDKFNRLVVDKIESSYWNRFGISEMDSNTSPFDFNNTTLQEYGDKSYSLTKKAMRLWLHLRGLDKGMEPINESDLSQPLKDVGGNNGQPPNKTTGLTPPEPGGVNKNLPLERQIVTLENTCAGDLGDIGSWDEGDIVAEFELVADAIDYDSNPNYRDLIYNAIKDKLNDDLQDSLEECSLDKFASEVRELAKNHQEIKKIIEALNLDRSKKQYNCQVRIKDRDGTCIEIEIGLTDKKDGTVLNQYSNIILIINNKKVEILDFYPNTAQVGIEGFEDRFMVSLIRSILKNDYKSLTINDVDSDYWNRFGFDKLGKLSPFASKDPRMLKFGEHTASISREAMQLWLYLRGYGPKPIEDILKQANTSKDGSKLSKVGSDNDQPPNKPPVIDDRSSPDKDSDGESERLPTQRVKSLQRVLEGIGDLAIVIKNTNSIDASLIIKELIKLHDLEYKKSRGVAISEQLDDIIGNYPAIPDLNIQQLLTKISHALYHCLKNHPYQAPDGATFTDWVAVGLPAIRQLTKILNPDSTTTQITLTRDMFKQFYLASLQNQGRYNFKEDYWPGILNNLPMHSFMAFQGGVLKEYIEFLEVKLNKIKNLERLSRETNIPIEVLDTRDIPLIIKYLKDSDRLEPEDDFNPLGMINSIIQDKKYVKSIEEYSKARLDEFNNANSIIDLIDLDDYPIILENGLIV
ncbi:MAG: hypothetical protein H7230_02850, partial [Candidatus Parcubacteria bacterium]|nr:hypothetical protein [Candidatus Paceibacterota bacterium]